jgi:riboflavin synthase
MFTGIIETLGQIVAIERTQTNIHFKIKSSISDALKIDQSLAHDGVCLTVTACDDSTHTVTAIEETLLRTNLNSWAVDRKVNLERAMVAGARLDGHMVQGHVDATATCINIDDRDGSWNYTFRYAPSPDHILVDKGSVCINGTSLTVVNPVADEFTVCIIPYTYDNTVFHQLAIGDAVNIEFDIIGKYIAKHLAMYQVGKV